MPNSTIPKSNMMSRVEMMANSTATAPSSLRHPALPTMSLAPILRAMSCRSHHPYNLRRSLAPPGSGASDRRRPLISCPPSTVREGVDAIRPALELPSDRQPQGRSCRHDRQGDEGEEERIL